jgi:hypothetical protein
MPFRSLVHGGIIHGGQLLEPALRFQPSSYFGPSSGYGRLFASLPDRPRHIGVIGLGAGSPVAHGRKGDRFRLYEINPQVVELARREFTFLSESPATTEVVLGDGRLSLEREPSQGFDVLAMDAFSGDSIPMHRIALPGYRCALVQQRTTRLPLLGASGNPPISRRRVQCSSPQGMVHSFPFRF